MYLQMYIPNLQTKPLKKDIIKETLLIYLTNILHIIWTFYLFKLHPYICFMLLVFSFESMSMTFLSSLSLFDVVDHRLLYKTKIIDEKKERNNYIHIILTCFGEDESLIENTLISILNIDYPKDKMSVYLCDDTTTASYSNLANKYKSQNVKYLCRKLEKDKIYHRDMKAGNLNYALKHLNYLDHIDQFILTVDADMIVHENIINEMLPHILSSNNIGFVQIPQTFSNIPLEDPYYQHNYLIFRYVFPILNKYGHNFGLGTGTLYRLSILNEINGFKTNSISEDVSTSGAMFTKGYSSCYIQKCLQIGLAPKELSSVINQICRWNHGSLTVVFESLKDKNVSLKDKISIYLTMIMHWIIKPLSFAFYELILPILIYFNSETLSNLSLPYLITRMILSIINSYYPLHNISTPYLCKKITFQDKIRFGLRSYMINYIYYPFNILILIKVLFNKKLEWIPTGSLLIKDKDNMYRLIFLFFGLLAIFLTIFLPLQWILIRLISIQFIFYYVFQYYNIPLWTELILPLGVPFILLLMYGFSLI
jgi:cellulose synthase/poly-beta-1,6-N-acetylglucosamine synthase-like glycosyltransferase